jgi:hypothetical protein
VFITLNQTFVIQAPEESGTNGLAPIGTRAEIIQTLSRLNTAPEREGEDVLWGPGVRIDLPPNQDPVEQMLLSIVEEEIAFLVIMRIGRICQWRILDPETGRELNP